MENYKTYKITKDNLGEIQQCVEAKALFWVDPIPFDGKTFPPFLLVALPNGGTLSIKRAREKIITSGRFPLRLANLAFCHYQGLKAGMKRDGLFHLLHLSKKRLVSPEIPLSFQTVSTKFLESRYDASISQFNAFAQKAVAFRQGALDYWEKNDYATAAFMFHQALELGFHAAEVFALGKAKRSHWLSSHILSAEYYAPALSTILLTEGHNAISPVPLLEKAYLGARYCPNFTIAKDEIASMPELMEKFISRLFQVPSSYKAAIDAFTPTPINSTTTKTTAMSNEDRKALIKPGLNQELRTFLENLVDKFDIEYVYCFGIQTREGQGFSPFMFSSSSIESRYDLLIITNEPDPSPIQDFCLEAQASGTGIFAIIHLKREVDDSLKKQSRFFNTIIQNGHLFYGKQDGNGFKVSLPDYQYVQQSTIAHWQTRYNRASYYFQAVECSDRECPEVSMFLLHLGVEQLALGIIYTYMGYIPKFRSLSYLLALCGNFTSTFSELFINEEYKAEELLKSLCASFSGTRFNPGYKVDTGHVPVIFERIPELAKSLQQLHEEKIKQLQSLMQDSEQDNKTAISS
ncbi:HEPN domain-containing protein [Echinicola rosea]|uniref:HEPN domain-containing protein n=1 Tax=Echinicola rosea TaxID=1807691 RepID=A0ABQ1V6B1_9BACT|nr:HEPN domain-containing protein [Echinicola rosea]GGF38571.1 hypothetical protein GCM10011339_28960 [Echinicola rosea]